MSVQVLTFPYSLNAYMAVTKGMTLPAGILGEGQAYTNIEIEYDADSVPTHDTAAFMRETQVKDSDTCFLEFELTEIATGKVHCLHLPRARIDAHRVFFA